jgi:hypothetical protein
MNLALGGEVIDRIVLREFGGINIIGFFTTG